MLDVSSGERDPSTRTASFLRRRMIVAGLFSAAAFSLAPATEPSHSIPDRGSATDRPNLNVITIIVDDMDDFSCAETKDFLPKSSKWLLEQGRCFEHASTSSPVCCPARSVIQTGQLSHNNGVRRQIDAKELTIKNTVQYNLGQLGLATYGTGKFLNGIGAGEFAKGTLSNGFKQFDFWNTYSYEPQVVDTQVGDQLHSEALVHPTERVGLNLRSFIDTASETDTPFYAYAAFFAPHSGKGQTELDRFPRPTSAHTDTPVPPFIYNPEFELEDKLPIFDRLNHTQAFFEAFHAARVRALYDVDDQIAATFEQLEEKKLLGKTAVLFMSDNGYLLGENGWDGKAVPYSGSVDIPLLAYFPNEPGGVVDTRDVGLVDIAPTIYDLYGITPNHQMDGHSLRSKYSRESGQYYEFSNETSKLVLHESGKASLNVPTWSMYRKGALSYIEYYDLDGSLLRAEFYDDPEQKRNLLYPKYADSAPDPAVLDAFKQALEAYKTCTGTQESDSYNPCP